MEYLKIGSITKPYGLKGEVKVYPTTYFASRRFVKGRIIFVLNKETNVQEEKKIKLVKKQGELYILLLEGIEDINQLTPYLGSEVLIEKRNEDLPKETYYFSDLEGCEVKDELGTLIGKVSKVEEYPAQLTLRIKRDSGSDVLIPFIKAFIIDVNLEKKEIIAKIIGGML